MYKKIISIFLTCVLFLSAMVIAPISVSANDSIIWDGKTSNSFAGGQGTKDDPYLISTPSQLSYMNEQIKNGNTFSGKYIKLINNIYLNDISGIINENFNSNGYNKWVPGGEFRGIFLGDHHTIYGLVIDNANGTNVGLFAKGGSGSDVSSLYIRKSFIKGARNVGSFYGVQNSTASGLFYCYSDAVVVGNSCVGGLVGATNSGGYVWKCMFGGKVSATQYGGGIVGYLLYATIDDSINRGTVYSESYSGGLCGYNDGSKVRWSLNAGYISGSQNCDGISGNGGYVKDNYYVNSYTNSLYGVAISSEKAKDLSNYSIDGVTDSWAVTPGYNDGYPYPKPFDINSLDLFGTKTEELYLFLAKNYPEYLNNAAENAYLGSCTSICYDVLEQYSDTHTGILAFAESFVNGTEIIIRELAAFWGIIDSTQEEWLDKNATEYLKELQGCEDVVKEGWEKVEEIYDGFKFSLEGIDLYDTIQTTAAKKDFIKKVSVKSSRLSEADVQKLADNFFEKQPNGISNFFEAADYVVDGADVILFSCQMLEVEMYTLETLKENVSTDSPLYDAICGNLSDIQTDPVSWMTDKYLSNAAVKVAASLLDDFVDWSGGIITTGTNLSVTSAVVKTVAALIYSVYPGAKIDEIYGATVAYDFYTTVSSSRTKLLTQMIQTKMNGGTPSDDLIEDYRFMYEAKRVAMGHYAKACLNINKEDGYDSLLESIKEESSNDGLLGFDNYIDNCMAAYLRDVDAGTVNCNHANCKYVSTVNPTCTAQGYDKYVCNVCGVSFNKNYVAAKGHSYTSKITAPTCTTQGYTTYTCSCGNSYKSNYVASKGHSYSFYETVEPTYTTQGYDVFKCNNCGDTYKTNYTEVVAKSHTVTFKDQADFGGEVLATLTVNHGSAATAPTVAPEDGWEFYGWDTDFSNVTEDITVTAIRVNMNVQLLGLIDGWNTGSSMRMTYNSDGTSSKTIELKKGTYQLKLYTEEWGSWLGNNNPVDDSCTDWHMSESANNLVLNASGGLYTFTYTRDTGMLSIAYTPATSKVTASANPPQAGSVSITNENLCIGDTTTITATESEGYTFSKWSVTGGTSGTDYRIVSGSTTSKTIEIQPLVMGKTIKVTAVFSIKSYAVKFVDWDGTVLSTQTVQYGGSATAPEVPSRAGYNFSGWDSDYSSITESLVVTATYVKIPTGTLRVNITGGTGFTISIDRSSAKPQGSVYRNSKLPIGAVVTVVAKETADTTFAGWMNPATGIVLSSDYEYTFTASGNDIINAVFSTQIEGVQIVTFKNDKSNRILDSQYYAAEDTIEFPDAPTQVGYDFAGWSMTEAEIKNAVANGEDVTVVAQWTKALVPVEVTVSGGTGSGTYYANNAVTVTANAPENGRKFAYWTDAQGNIRSYNAEYTFFPSTDTTVTAVFVDADAEIDYQILVSLDSIDTATVADKNVFTYSWYCPERYTFVKAGIVAVNKSNYNEDTFVAGSSDANVYDRSPNTANNIPVNTYTWTKSNVTSGQTWVARAYVQYKDSSGRIITVYSDMVEATKD